MKLIIESINPRFGSDKGRMNVTIKLMDDHPEPPFRNAELKIFVPNSLTTIEEIHIEAINQAHKFVSELEQDLRQLNLQQLHPRASE